MEKLHIDLNLLITDWISIRNHAYEAVVEQWLPADYQRLQVF